MRRWIISAVLALVILVAAAPSLMQTLPLEPICASGQEQFEPGCGPAMGDGAAPRKTKGRNTFDESGTNLPPGIANVMKRERTF